MTDEVSRQMITRGGTFYICHHDTVTETRRPKYDKRGRKTRYTEIIRTVEPDCKQRFRISRGTSRISRHVRRVHGDV
jgi:hypothetical protein